MKLLYLGIKGSGDQGSRGLGDQGSRGSGITGIRDHGYLIYTGKPLAISYSIRLPVCASVGQLLCVLVTVPQDMAKLERIG